MFYLVLLKDACRRWYADNTFRTGAALAFYTVFSLAPLVLIALAIAGAAFDRQEAERQLLNEIRYTAGDKVADALAATMEFGKRGAGNVEMTLVSAAMLLFAATAVFVQLQDALNTIWGVKARVSRDWVGMLRDRAASFAIVIMIGFLLLVSLILSAVLHAISTWAVHVPSGLGFWQAIDWLVSFGLITIVFAATYKLLPDVELRWKPVWAGAALTALLFEAGKYLIGLYLTRSSWISAYHAAGSLIVILVWVYYSSQIFLFGAEVTCVYACRTGECPKPKAHAEPVTEEARAREGMERQRPAGKLAPRSESAGSPIGLPGA